MGSARLTGHKTADSRLFWANEQVVQAHRPEQPIGPGQAGVAVHLTGDRCSQATAAAHSSSAHGTLTTGICERLGAWGILPTRNGVRCMKGRRSSTEAMSSSERLLRPRDKPSQAISRPLSCKRCPVLDAHWQLHIGSPDRCAEQTRHRSADRGRAQMHMQKCAVDLATTHSMTAVSSAWSARLPADGSSASSRCSLSA